MPRYDAQRIEPKWQAYWDKHQTFRTPDVMGLSDLDRTRKLYVLDMFPYPSGSGLHVGHPEGYTATDIVCRFARMQGKHVLHPMGWDAFGLPAEEHAVKTGTHPRITTEQNINTFRRQLKSLGFSYDWNREISTTDVEYYRWTQWIFLQVFDTWYDPAFEWTGKDGQRRVGKGRPIAELPIPADVKAQGEETVRRYQDRHRLAYQHEAPVNWCPALGTVLANEEVVDGRSERGNHPVERVPLRQWMLRITAYAERLIDDLEPLDWSESIKILQRNWIGRSEGAEVDFYVGAGAGSVEGGMGRGGEGGTASAGESSPSTLNAQPSTSFDAWKSHRAANGFPAEPGDDVLRIYTTRPDTLYGATYMVIAPEHPFVARLTTADQKDAVEAYCRKASQKSDLDRTDLAKDKTGVFTGSYAINPVNGARVPVWIADYVLISYGTGAIMAVPAHDLRDWEFAVKFQLPIIPVVQPPAKHEPSKEERALTATINGEERCPFAGEGMAINSGRYDGTTTLEFKKQITAELAKAGLGRKAVNYRLRDWLFSRQRYWGEPFPIWHELDAQGQPTGLMRPDAEAELPVLHPHLEDFKPTGNPEPMLSKAPEDWLYKTAADGVRLKRETNSMPQWAGSCWYYLRFCDPNNTQHFIDPAVEKYWLPVDLYVGGAEHAVLHLLYARFWHKVLFDRGHVSTVEPFQKLVNQGMILGEVEFTGFWRGPGLETSPKGHQQWSAACGFAGFVSARDVVEKEIEGNTVHVVRGSGESVQSVRVPADQIEKKGEGFILKAEPAINIDARAFKMSKSRGNVINPDKVVEQYGADSLRLYEMFMGPLEQVKPWSMSGVEGVFRFLGRVWRMVADDRADDVKLSPAVQDVPASEAQLRTLHKTIKAVTEDIEKMSFNTAISRMMEFTNEISGQEPRPKSILEPFVLLLSPFAPHLAEELWELLGHKGSLAYTPWPRAEEKYLVENEVEIPVQINGKLRAVVRVPAGADQAALKAAAESHEAIAPQLAGKTIAKCVVVPGRMVNFVVKG